MKSVTARGMLAAFVALLAATGCGGGGGGGGGGNPAPANVAPSAVVGGSQVVDGGATVTLNGSASSDPDGSIATYTWTQTGGTSVFLNSANSAQPTFVAPTGPSTTALTFSLVVTDNRGASSAAATVTITVNPPNAVPSANAGPAQTVQGRSLVTLDGTASVDPDGTIATFAWSQVSGPVVVLAGANTSRPTFTAPDVSGTTTLMFQLQVTDNRGLGGSGSTVVITVTPATPNVTLTGQVRFTRIPFLSASPFTLDYANPVLQPARRVRISVVNAGDQAVLSSGSTTSTGNYALVAPSNTSVFVRVTAWIDTDPSAPALAYDVRVQDGTASTAAVYAYDSPVFNSSAPPTQVDIPSGLSSTGTQVGTRSSGPFAMLDTVYRAIQFVSQVAPSATLPPLYIDWGTQKGGTFFSTANGAHIALQADLTEDTDEFDQHVVAHEFGHYIERYFSRSDSLGGSHALGNRLDPRVAWGEGWATAFGAMALNDPLYRDSFFRNGAPAVGGFVIENNPTTPATAPDSSGCWCSESSVSAILWDLYDSNADGNDGLALGFPPLWSVLTGAQRTTPAVTSIFSFIEALKVAQPFQVPAINQLVAAQNIDATGIDAFASNETHTPITGTLPVFRDVSVGVPVVFRSIDDGGHYNRLGNHQLLRFTPVSSGTVTINLTTSNPDPQADPDFVVFRSGTPVAAGTGPPPQPEVRSFSVTAGTTYVIDAYDCANGCSPVEGTAGDYDLTLTIN